MKSKYYHLRLEEINGEQEYSHDSLIVAENMKDAEGFAHQHARTWYDDEDVEETEPGVFEFFHGCIIVRIMELAETTREKFVSRLLSIMTLNPNGHEIPKPKTIITVGGGCLRDVYSEVNADVELFDYDNAECGDGDFNVEETDKYIEREVSDRNMYCCF
jgi:hypothetical protein